MRHLRLVCVGKLKESFWREAEAEYLKRLRPYFKIDIKELKEESFTEKDNPEVIKQKEAGKILAALPAGTTVLALDGGGEAVSSVRLAEKIERLTNDLVIVIGGPLGLSEQVLKSASWRLSLSSLTFTHQLARVIWWEQLYRAIMIKEGRKYHY